VKKGEYVRLQKLGALVNGLPACPLPLYEPGAYEGLLSLPVTYWMEGYLQKDLQKLDRIYLDRRVRFGVVAEGEFVSSPITVIHGDLVSTFNSLWQVRRVPPLEPMEAQVMPTPVEDL
jgi:hypothetical protein